MGEGRSISPQAYLNFFIILDNTLKYANKVPCQLNDIFNTLKRRVNTVWTEDKGSRQSGTKEGRKVGGGGGGGEEEDGEEKEEGGGGWGGGGGGGGDR